MAVFINKHIHSKTLGRSTHEERKLINEQNRARRAKRSSNVSCAARRRSSPPKVSQRSSNLLPILPDSSLTSEDGSIYDCAEPRSPPYLAGYSERETRLLPPWSSMPRNAIDPFDTNVLQINAEIATILHYYIEVLWLHQWRDAASTVDFELDMKALQVRPAQQVISGCLQKKARLQTLVAHTAAHMQHQGGIKLQKDSLKYVQEATTTFLGELNETKRLVDRDMLLQVFHLSAAAVASQQFNAMRIHINGARTLIDLVDKTCCEIDASIVALLTIINVDAPRTLVQYLPPDQRDLWLHLATEPRFESSDVNHLILESSPTSIATNRSEIATLGISQTIRNCRRFADFFQSAIDNGENRLAVTHRLSVQDRALCQSVLLHDAPDSRFQCLLHTLMIWLWTLAEGKEKLIRSAVLQVKQQLQSILMEYWSNDYDVLLWISLINAMASADGSKTQKYFWYHVVFASRLQRVFNDANEDKTLRESRLKQHALKYLWVEAVHGPRLNALVKTFCR